MLKIPADHAKALVDSFLGKEDGHGWCWGEGVEDVGGGEEWDRESFLCFYNVSLFLQPDFLQSKHTLMM